MKIKGQRYSFVGTFCAIIIILIMFFLSKYVFKSEGGNPEEQEPPTESTYEYPVVTAELGVLPSE